MHYAYAFTKVDNLADMYKTIKEVDSQVNNAIQNAHACIYSQEKMSNEIIGASLSEPHTGWKTVCTSVTYTVIMNEDMR